MWVIAALLLIVAGRGAPAQPAATGGTTQPARDLSEIIGVTHVAGAYCLTDKGFLQEGAEQVQALGVKVIKLYLHKVDSSYPFHEKWPEARSLVELARAPQFERVFRMPFRTYILTVYSLGRPEHYWREGITPEQTADERRQFRELASHFLTAYRGTGKTFVLSHWEGDWAIRGSFKPELAPTAQAAAGMAGWLNARQAGVDAARREGGQGDVRVLHAAEVNLVVQAMRAGRRGVTDLVLPRAAVDLVSYSAWDGQGDPNTLRAALDFIARNAADRPPYGAKNVYIGEFGKPANESTPQEVRRTLRDVVTTAVDWGCPYVVYWQVYCNEPRRRPARANADVRGFWLIRPDGTKAEAWDCLRELLGPRAGPLR